MLITHLRAAVQRNMDAHQYKDAIFYADKVVHLISAPAAHEEFHKAVYDLAACFLADKQNARCVELLERYELTDLNLKFRILTGKALLRSNNIQACIKLLMPDPT